MEDLKKCSGPCQEEKDRSEFYKDKSRKDGLQLWCINCQSIYRSQNKERDERYKNKMLLMEKEKIENKCCFKCKKIKLIEEFSKNKYTKDGFQSWCRSCLNNALKKSCQKRVEGKLLIKKIKNKKCCKCKKIKSLKCFVKDLTRADGYVSMCKKCRSKNTMEWNKKKYKEDIFFRFRKCVSDTIRKALKDNGGTKKGYSIFDFLPYTFQQLKENIESKFESWMNWDNYGVYEKNKGKWNIDHIIPQSLLLYDNMDHPNFQKCWALENLRPLEAVENMKKSNKIIK